jgi:hypothetical protein
MMGFEEARNGALATTVPAAASFINFRRDFFMMTPLDSPGPHAVTDLLKKIKRQRANIKRQKYKSLLDK